MKKAQVVGQVFIFILAAGLAVLIIGYGFKAITTFTARTDDIALANFKADLQSNVKTISSDFGSVKKVELVMPGGYTKLCLVDLTSGPSGKCICTLGCQDYNPFVCDSWETARDSDKFKDNAFLVSRESAESIQVSPIEADNGYVCITPIGSRLTLRLEGLGRATKVSEWIG